MPRKKKSYHDKQLDEQLNAFLREDRDKDRADRANARHNTYPPAFNWTPAETREGPRNWNQFLEDQEFEVHDSFTQGMMDYERIRLCVANEIDRVYPERATVIRNAIGAKYQTTKAQTVVDFLNDVFRALASQKVSITRAEVERHTMAYLWGMIGEQKTEIRRLKDRVRKYKK